MPENGEKKFSQRIKKTVAVDIKITAMTFNKIMLL